MAPKKAAASFLDLQAGDDDAGTEDDDDVPLSSLHISAEETVAREKDKEFINDTPSLSRSPRNEANSSDEGSPPVAPRRSGRLMRNGSAVSLPRMQDVLDLEFENDVVPVIVDIAVPLDFGSSSSSSSRECHHRLS